MRSKIPPLNLLAIAWQKLLPGDVIHDEAPIHKQSARSGVVVSNIDQANAKRARKAERRRSQGA